MSCEQRFRRLVNKLDMSVPQMAEIFGVDRQAAQDWYWERAKMRPEYRRTLLRLEADHLPELAPAVSPKTVQAFYEGRARAMRMKQL